MADPDDCDGRLARLALAAPSSKTTHGISGAFNIGVQPTNELNNLWDTIKYGVIEEGQMGINAGHELAMVVLPVPDRHCYRVTKERSCGNEPCYVRTDDFR